MFPITQKMFAVLLVPVVFSLSGCDFLDNILEKKSSTLPPPTAIKVGVMPPVMQEIVDYEEFTGRTEAVNSVEIRAQVSGVLAKVCYTPGSEVQENHVFFELEPEVFMAQRDRAKGALAVLEARLPRLDSELKRAEELKPEGAISDEDYDRIVSDRRECNAQIATAKAELKKAEIDLKYTKIRSPIKEGVIGRELVTVGNLVTAGTTKLAEMVSLNPIYVIFNVDEGTLLKLMRRMEAEGESVKDLRMAVTFRLSDGVKEYTGTIQYNDPYMDKSSGTLLMRATCGNPKNALGMRDLMPGMMVHVRIPVTDKYTATLVPEEATGSDQGKRYVYVVDEEGKAKMRHIMTGPLVADNMRVVRSGLSQDEQIIMDNLLLLRPGSNVEPKPITLSELRGEGRAKVMRTVK